MLDATLNVTGMAINIHTFKLTKAHMLVVVLEKKGNLLCKTAGGKEYLELRRVLSDDESQELADFFALSGCAFIKRSRG
jgi:hypothetical protein